MPALFFRPSIRDFACDSTPATETGVKLSVERNVETSGFGKANQSQAKAPRTITSIEMPAIIDIFSDEPLLFSIIFLLKFLDVRKTFFLSSPRRWGSTIVNSRLHGNDKLYFAPDDDTGRLNTSKDIEAESVLSDDEVIVMLSIFE